MAGNALNPFQFEPRYTAEEVERRRAEGIQRNEPIVRPENDRSRILRRRLEGVVPVDEWCECGACAVPFHPTAKMCQCCVEHDALTEKMEGIDCIVQHSDFEAVCLTPAVLHIVVNSMEEIRGYGANIEEWTNRLYRHVSYRSYTYWIHRRLGRYNRRVIPACVVQQIRKQWPEENEQYVSYKEAGDEVGDAWLL